LIATRELREAHTGLNIAALLSNILTEWGIKDKIVTIVSGNGPTLKIRLMSNSVNTIISASHIPLI